ncbi:hypothetical protein ACROYT_G011469 [Oculina patagonica]
MRDQDGISGLFFGSLPNLEELVAAKATIQMNKDDEIGAIQPMCCRELIFTEPKVLVSPLLEERNQLFLITPKLTFQSSQFQELLQKLKIQSTEPMDLTKRLFQFCFSFTMKQKLAPLWNKAGEFLVQALEVTISDKICIGLQACSLKSTPCKPEHFTASTRALQEFNTNSEAMISDAAISDDLCFVLPSLKKGRIFSITHQLPEDCPFASYEELRKHWKLMSSNWNYGRDRCIYNESLLQRYPASCIRSSQVLVSPRCDHQLIFSSFLRDLSCRMPAVCGTPLTLTSSPLYPTSRLQHATHANHSNLTRTAPPQFSHCRPFTIQPQRIQEATTQTGASPSASQVISSQASSLIQSLKGRNNAVNQALATPVCTALTDHSLTPFVPRFTSTRVMRSDDSERTAPTSLVSPSSSGARIIPMFSRKRVQSHVKEPAGNKNIRQTTALTRGAAPKATAAESRVPMVHTTVHAQNALSSVSSLNSPGAVERARMENPFEANNMSLDHTLPEQISCQIHQSNMMMNGGRISQGIGEIPSLTLCQEWTIESMSKNSSLTVFHQSSYNGHDVPLARSPSVSTQVSKCLPETRPGLVVTPAPIGGHLATSFTSNTPRGPMGDTVSLNMEQRSMRDENYSTLGGTAINRLPTSVAGQVREGIGLGQLFQPFSTSIQSSGVLARKRQVNGFPNEVTPSKKPKSKPKLQENVDVRELAIQDQLHKVNTVTLADWLKKRGVAVKSKDKKAELASKARQYLGLVQHEQ